MLKCDTPISWQLGITPSLFLKMASDLDNVHKDMSEIKSLLLKLLEKASKGGGQVLRQEDGNTC